MKDIEITEVLEAKEGAGKGQFPIRRMCIRIPDADDNDVKNFRDAMMKQETIQITDISGEVYIVEMTLWCSEIRIIAVVTPYTN